MALRLSVFGLPSVFGFRPSDFPKALLPLLALLTIVPWGLSQPLAPHIGYVYPAGGRQGTTVELAVGGQYLNNASGAFVSGAGVEAKVGEFTRPLTQKEFNDLRDKLKELQEKRTAAARAGRRSAKSASSQNGTNVVWTAADETMTADIRQKLFLLAPRKNLNPAIAETVTLRVMLATNAEPGEREIRLATPTGLSNPLRFWVGQLPESVSYTHLTLQTKRIV